MMFSMLTDTFKDCQFLYTDGSKTDIRTSFSVTSENRVIQASILPPYSTIYSAELIAIYEALRYAKAKRGKFVICSDSLSSLLSIKNLSNNNYYVSKIRNILINKSPNITLIWIPGHCDIPGNDFADCSAKDAINQPLHLTQNFNRKDIDNLIVQSFTESNKNHIYDLSSSWYRRVNISKKSVDGFSSQIQKEVNRLDIIKFERLRLGHTLATHGPIFNTNYLPFCNCDISYPAKPSHFLYECQKTQNFRLTYFQNSDPLDLLSNPSIENIKLIICFLKKCNIYKEI